MSEEQMDDARKLAIIEEGLASDFWKEILKPMLEARCQTAYAAWKDPSLARKHKVPDNYLRGALDLAETLLDQPRLIADSLRTAILEERIAKERDMKDSVIAHFGRGSFVEDE